MSTEKTRSIEAQQRQIRQLTKELSTAREIIKDVYSLVPKQDTSRSPVTVIRKKVSHYLEDRGLI